MRIFSVFFSLFIFTAALAGDIRVNDKLRWKENTRLQTGPQTWVEVLSFFGAHNDVNQKYLPVYTKVVNLPAESELQFEFVNAKYEPVTTLPAGFDANSVATDIKVSYSIGYFKKKPIADISFVPLRRNNYTGQIERLVEFDLQVRYIPTGKKQQSSSALYATTSVLNSGSWYKVSVDKDGLYKIDYQYLKDIGINPDNIDPRNVHVYGNGGGILPEANNVLRHDDLTENSIIVVGEGDGVFNQGDYILFYGEGPDRWHQVDSIQGFHHDINIYSKVTAYFITANGTPGKRIGTIPQASNPTETVTTFNDFQFHDVEDVNFIQSGRQWFGEFFNFSVTSQSFPFDFPNLVTSSPVFMRTSAAARSLSATTTFNFTANGVPVTSHTLGTITTDYTSEYARTSIREGTFNSSSGTINVTAAFNNPSSSAEGWLDYIELNVRRSLIYSGGLLHFRDWHSVGPGKRAEFIVQGVDGGTKILDVTDPTNVGFRHTSLNGSQLSFVANTDVLREFVAYNDNSPLLTPGKIGPVANQNLHGIGQPDMIIVTFPTLVDAANRLANQHRTHSSLNVAVVDVQQIYNEFSSGTQDISAIRDFVRMLYERAGSNPDALPQYLLLFGDGSYDYKDLEPNNTNMVPTYESYNSTSPILSYCSDDFFGFMDVTEGADAGRNDKVDIAIGRIPVSTLDKANDMVNKIIHYQSNTSFGSWRNNVTFVGDDEDNNTHQKQSLEHAVYIEDLFPVYNVDKIMLDAFKQQSTPAGSRYPDVKEAINKKMFAGTLIMNYTGHGGVNGLAHERVLDVDDIRSWQNYDKMPLFVTATCEFSKFDDPNKAAAGEEVFLNPDGGAIALVTTVRLVFSHGNKAVNDAFLENVFHTYDGVRMPTLGEATMLTKRDVTGENSRKFVLLGDPALTLAYPQYDVVTTHIDDHPISVTNDTMKALQKITIKGEVRDLNGAKMTGFNGTVYPTIFDKKMDITTLGNDPASYPVTFKLLKNIIFKGKATVTAGEFSYTFIVPKDISYSYGQGKISYYAENSVVDAHGYTTDVYIGGTADSFATDGEGPELKVFMNDEKFVLGGLTDASPLLLVKLEDFSGINTVGNGIGHDITGILDENTQKTLVLNDFYESAKDDYQKGEVRYPLDGIADGRHTMKVKAWDVYNNSAEGYTEFVVASSADIALDHVLNYPNPFTTSTNFMFEHNKPGESLFVQVKIFTVSGKLVKTIQQHVQTEGYRIDDIHWDGLDDYGDKIGKGVYVYKLNVSTPSGETANKFEKLVILR